MRALTLKLGRDLGRIKTQAAAIALVVASGMALYIGTALTSGALSASEQYYYDTQRFADVWSRVAQAPGSVIATLAAIPGVASAEGRVIASGLLDVPGVLEPVTGLFVSIPADADHAMNGVYVRRGRHLVATGNEALVSEAFAERHGLKPGDSVPAVISGRPVSLRVVGIALSPEFVMQIPPGGVIPDSRRFAVIWMARSRLAELLDMREQVNDVSLRLVPGVAAGTVIPAVDRILATYGGEGAYARPTQPSHRMLEGHIRPVRALAVVVPSIFLLVAVFLTNVVLSRLVATERAQLGMLKAFGYSSFRLVGHYLALLLIIVSAGIVAGVPIGLWLGHLMSVWFATFFAFPILVFKVSPATVGTGAAAILVSSSLGTLATLWGVVSLPPVVAMAAAPPLYSPTFVDRITPILGHLTPATRMVVRSVFRRPARAILATGGMSLAVAIVVFGGFTADALDRVVDVRFQHEERQDLSLVLAHPRAIGTIAHFAALPGVRRAEPYRVLPGRIRASNRTQDVAIVGLPPEGVLRQLIDADYRRVNVPPTGMVMSHWLAAQLGLKRGMSVDLEVRDGRGQTVSAPLVDLADMPMGTSVYMDLGALGRALGEPQTLSAVSLKIDPNQEQPLFTLLKRTPSVIGVEFRKAAIANFRAMGDESVAFIRKIEVLFAIIIAFGVVYNIARIAVAERAYELATLRVLGFTRQEVSTTLLGEIGLLAVVSIPLGCAVGYQLSAWLSGALSSDQFRFPLVLEPRTYAFAIVVFLLAGLASALVVRRRLDHLDLIEVLKARE